MRELMSIRKSRRRTSWEKGGILDLLSKILMEYDKEGRATPPVDFIRSFYNRMPRRGHSGTGPLRVLTPRKDTLSYEERVSIGRAFFELCRVREMVDGLAADCLVLPADNMSVAVTLYLLTGYLRPENELILDHFLSSTDFNTIANAVYALERMPPIERYYYKHLIMKNLYSKDAVLRWSQKDEKSSKYANEFLADVNEEIQKYNGSLSKHWRESMMEREWTIIKIKNGKQSLKEIIERPKDNYLKSLSVSSLKSRKTSLLSIKSQSIQIKPQPICIGQEKKASVEEVTEESFFDKTAVKNISSMSNPKKTSKDELTNYADIFKTKLLESGESLHLNIQEVGENEVRNKSNRPKLQVLSRNCKRNDQLIKTRTDYRNEELVKEEKHKNFLSVRTNAATLLKEAAIILKEEEEANKKLLDLMVGSPNYLEYEKMIEERIAEEKELFKLKIQKLHLQGKLTEQGAILAKHRLIHESKLRREEFEKEKRSLLDDMAKLKENEEVKIMSLVSKVRDINERVALRKKNLKDEKRLEVEKISHEIKRSLKESMAKQKRELEEKVLVIKEVRAFEAFKKTLQRKGSKAIKDSPRLGLLCEMSMEELAERKKEMKSIITEEIKIRRERILNEVKEREALIDQAEQFVHEYRTRKWQKRMDKNARTNAAGKVNPVFIPDTFLRAVPPLYKNEINYIGILSEVKEIKRENTKKINKEKQKCHIKNKLWNSFYEKTIITKFKNKKSLPTYEFNENHLKIRKPHLFSTIVARTFTTSENIVQSKEFDTFKWKVWFIWRKFKEYMKKKLPKAYRKLTAPPKKWIPEELRNDLGEKLKRSEQRKANISMMRKLRKQKSKRQPSFFIKEKSWKRKWREFIYGFMEAEKRMKKCFSLENLQDTYTQSIIKQINYFINNRLNVRKEKILKTNSTVFKSKSEIKMLEKRIDLVSKKLKEAKQISLKESFSKTKKTKTPRKILVLPHCNDLINEVESIRNTIEHVVKVPLLEAEDNEIKETALQLSFKERTERNEWMTESNYELSQLKPIRREATEPVIHIWELPKQHRVNTSISKSPKQVPLEIKLLSRFDRKYSLLKNQFGNPVFMLRPVKNNPRKWEWYPVVITTPFKRMSVHAAAEIPPHMSEDLNNGSLELNEKRKLLVESLISSQKSNRNNLLAKLMAAQIRDCDYYLRGLQGKDRTDYFKNVPLKMILDYMETNPLGGIPLTQTF